MLTRTIPRVQSTRPVADFHVTFSRRIIIEYKENTAMQLMTITGYEIAPLSSFAIMSIPLKKRNSFSKRIDAISKSA